MGRRPWRDDVPDGATLKAELDAGATWRDLAEKYQCSSALIYRRVLTVTQEYPDARTPRPAPWPFAYPPWMDQGLCAQADPEAFFPDKGGSTREAKAICARCPVAAECLDHALEHQERFGVWGGLSERERRRINLDTSQEPA